MTTRSVVQTVKPPLLRSASPPGPANPYLIYSPDTYGKVQALCLTLDPQNSAELVQIDVGPGEGKGLQERVLAGGCSVKPISVTIRLLDHFMNEDFSIPVQYLCHHLAKKCVQS